MIEIRPIRHHETEAFLQVLCRVFSLDFDRAKSVFFADPLFDLGRKWALFDSGQIVSILTTTALPFGWGPAVGIAGVATISEARHRGLATKLLAAVLDECETRGERGAILFAHEPGLYTPLGFEHVDDVIQAPLVGEHQTEVPDALTSDDIRGDYDRWASASPGRLQRDDGRWSYWNFAFRCPEPFADGYIVYEAASVREVVYHTAPENWAIMPGCQWTGFKSLTAELGIPIGQPRETLLVMARGFPVPPSMFMTDQF